MNKDMTSTVKQEVGHTQKRTVVHIAFDSDIWARIKEAAAAKGMTASTFVRVASLAASEK